MLIALTALVFLLLGREIALRLGDTLDEITPIERVCYASVIGLAGWLATLWAAALLHVMTREVLLARTAVAAAATALLWWRRRTPIHLSRELHIAPRTLLILAVGLLPIILWSGFMLWRGMVLPPDSYDALAYHLPKAVLYARAHGYAYFSFLDPRLRNIPANYELLLSETMILQRTDQLTEWVSTLFYVLFVVAGAALTQRWWRGPWISTLASATFLAGVPVALLHSSADKNDLMVAYLMVAGMAAAGRFIASRHFAALIIAVLSFAMATGTKPQAGILAFCLAPLLFWRLVRPHVEKGRIVAIAVIAIAAFLFLGGAVYLSNVRAEGLLMGRGREGGGSVVMYGDWVNVWQAPYVLLAAPFSRSADTLSVPWSHEPWFWRRYEIFFAHLGVPFALCALAMPVCVARLARRTAGSLAERIAITSAALAAFAIMLPVRFIPHGMYAISLPRYALFIVPVVFGWTIAPLAAAAPSRSALIVATGALFFSGYAIDNAFNDSYSPLDYVWWAREHPGTRIIYFDPQRAAAVADHMAGPRDSIAIDCAFGSWIHPVFGADLQRPVEFIAQTTGPPVIDGDVKWVVIDRSWNIVWGTPEFQGLSEFPRFLGKGHVAPEDVRVLNALRGDNRFKLVFYNRSRNQAVFRRIR